MQACLLRHSKSYFLLHSLTYMISSMTILTLRLSLIFFSLLYERLCGFLTVSKWSMRSLAGKKTWKLKPQGVARLNTAQSARRNTMKNLIALIDSMGITALIGPIDLGTQGVTRPTLESGVLYGKFRRRTQCGVRESFFFALPSLFLLLCFVFWGIVREPSKGK